MPRKGNTTPLAMRFWPKVQKSDGCWLWTGARSGEYGSVYVGGGTQHAHRAAYELTYGRVAAGVEVCHTCDTPLCVRPDHLFLGTHSENMQDMVSKGRHVAQAQREALPRGDQHYTRRKPHLVRRGEQAPTVKVTAGLVTEIRSRYQAGGITQRALAAEYGVALSTICRIVKRDSWQHV
jgi:hypothetical protein